MCKQVGQRTVLSLAEPASWGTQDTERRRILRLVKCPILALLKSVIILSLNAWTFKKIFS